MCNIENTFRPVEERRGFIQVMLLSESPTIETTGTIRPVYPRFLSNIQIASLKSLLQLPHRPISRTRIWRDPTITATKARKFLSAISFCTAGLVI